MEESDGIFFWDEGSSKNVFEKRRLFSLLKAFQQKERGACTSPNIDEIKKITY